MKTKLLVEQHFHGCYGINFNTASLDDVLELSHKLLKEGIGYIFPTLVTDSVENIKRQIKIIKEAASKQTYDTAKICGVHLEGIFLNPGKKGIHNDKYFLLPTVENFKLVEDDFIKIVTLAPELCRGQELINAGSGFANSGGGLISYLNGRNLKVQAGHCIGADLTGCSGVTHMYNAMSPVAHRKAGTALSALLNNDIYTEVIADGIHVSDDALRLLFKIKPMNKILLISDCLPCTGYNSSMPEFYFAGSKIYYDGEKAVSADGTIAGSTRLLPDIVKILAQKEMFCKQYITNSYDYHKLNPYGEIEWDEEFNIVNVTY